MSEPKRVYPYVQDPGHGWLRVPLADLPAGFEPSSFSFRGKRFAWLEEDCDFPAFERLVPPFDVTEIFVDSFDRGRERFPGKSANE